MNVHDLKRALVDYVAQAGRTGGMVTRIVSFGFKYGMPIDADLVFDVRYLPNPHFVPELKPGAASTRRSRPTCSSARSRRSSSPT